MDKSWIKCELTNDLMIKILRQYQTKKDKQSKTRKSLIASVVKIKEPRNF